MDCNPEHTEEVDSYGRRLSSPPNVFVINFNSASGMLSSRALNSSISSEHSWCSRFVSAVVIAL